MTWNHSAEPTSYNKHHRKLKVAPEKVTGPQNERIVFQPLIFKARDDIGWYISLYYVQVPKMVVLTYVSSTDTAYVRESPSLKAASWGTVPHESFREYWMMIPSLKLIYRPWKMVLGRLLLFFLGFVFRPYFQGLHGHKVPGIPDIPVLRGRMNDFLFLCLVGTVQFKGARRRN